jgi:hypothetical protein
MLAYVLSSLGGFFLSLLSGNGLRDSVPQFAGWLTARQRQRFLRLWETVEKEAENPDYSAEDAAYLLAYEFPDEGKDLAPTKLGNILVSVNSYTYRQYGASLDAIWPILAGIVKKDDPDLWGQINNERDALTFLSTLSVLSVLMAIELITLIPLFFDSLWSLSWVVVFLVLAWVFYRATILKARAWSQGMRTAFDLYLGAAAKKLDLMALSDPLKKRERWSEVSAWLSIGALRNRRPPDLEPSPTGAKNDDTDTKATEPGVGASNKKLTAETQIDGDPLQPQKSDWYEMPKPAPEPVTVDHPPTVSKTVHSAVTDKWEKSVQDGRFEGCEIDFVIAVTNEGDSKATGVYLRVTDTRLPMLPTKVCGQLGAQGTVGSLEGYPVSALPGQPQSLLWFLPPLPAGVTHVLRYKVRYEISIIGGTSGMLQKNKIVLDNPSPNQVNFEIAVMNRNQLPVIIYDNVLAPVAFTWGENTANPSQVTQIATLEGKPSRKITLIWEKEKSRFVSHRILDLPL